MPLIPTRNTPTAAKKSQTCKRCGQQKTRKHFSLVKREHGLRLEVHSWCNECRRAYNARWMRDRRRTLRHIKLEKRELRTWQA